ncbi:MAG: peptide ABC transporter substrate-binding protein [Rhodospirillaceae bacterium]|nr:peptide ABC transporter substrate-binding protein [Rhodospirillaceae bacterium]
MRAPSCFPGPWFRRLASAAALAGAVLAALPAEAVVTFRRGNSAEPETLDPGRAGTTWENAIIGDLFEGLTADDAEAKPIPGAAESWSVSPDGLVWTFKLRPGLLWSDGAPLTASDFQFAFRRLLDPVTASKYAFILHGIKNGREINRGKVPVEALGVRVLDPRTLEITLEGPTPFLPELLKHYAASPIPAHAYKKFGDAWVKPENMVTNGPYTLADWIPNDHVTLAKNPRYYDAAHVAIDQIIYVPLEDTAGGLTRFRADGLEAHLGRRSFPPDQRAWLDENMPGQAHVVPYLANEYLVGNVRRPPFDDACVRRAVSLCLDRELLTRNISRDGSLPADAFVPPNIANYHPNPRLDFAGRPLSERRAETARLLNEAGFGPNHPLSFEYKHIATLVGRRQAIAVSAMLKDCGIVARLYANESKIYYTALQRADFEFAWAAWVGDYNDPHTFLYLLDSRAGVYNYGGYRNPAYDALMDVAQTTLDLEKRAGILQRAEQIILDDSAIIPLSFTTHSVLVSPRVRGYADNPANFHRTRWMSLAPEA